MNRVLVIGLSNTMYGLLLRLYPAEIRRRWEREMAETFALQVDDAWQERGFVAVPRIWYRALAEVFQIALPLQIANAAVLVPVVSLAGATAIFLSLIWALENSLALNALVRSLSHKFGG